MGQDGTRIFAQSKGKGLNMMTVIAFGFVAFSILIQFIVLDNRIFKLENTVRELNRKLDEEN